jgi:predicted transcriptional regulator of viral defense system
MTSASPTTPSWDDLFDLAAGQDGLFSTAQAAEAGYSPQLLQKHLRAGRVRRVRRGVYRLVHFPPGEHDDLAAVWLWSNRAGVFSHETALSLHELSSDGSGYPRAWSSLTPTSPRSIGRGWGPSR